MNQGDQPRWHQLEVHQVLAQLQASREGLTPGEVARRLAAFGPNELAAQEAVRPWRILLRQVQSPLIYILIAAAVVTIFLGDLVDTAVMLAVRACSIRRGPRPSTPSPAPGAPVCA